MAFSKHSKRLTPHGRGQRVVDTKRHFGEILDQFVFALGGVICCLGYILEMSCAVAAEDLARQWLRSRQIEYEAGEAKLVSRSRRCYSSQRRTTVMERLGGGVCHLSFWSLVLEVQKPTSSWRGVVLGAQAIARLRSRSAPS
jgi:hypothetical protein